MLQIKLNHEGDWRQILRSNFTNWLSLADFLELTPLQRSEVNPKSDFPLNLPFRLASKIKKGTLDDPILKQFLPTKSEVAPSDFFMDPVGDEPSRQSAKLLKKYRSRALIIATSACAMHCRFCFRQHFPYETERKDFESEIALIESDFSVKEVILSGGDPLSLSNATLESLLNRLDAIPHVNRIRFHTRFPIGIPERIDSDFLRMLSRLRSHIYFVIHCNHVNELDEEIFCRLSLLQTQGAVLLNQTVLLKGVNDDYESLLTLFEALVDNGVQPYYLHQLDKVKGAAHFEVSEADGKKLISRLREVLPGYALPRYVKEIAGDVGKFELV